MTPKERKTESRKLILIGNPNVGKSVIFNFLTGKYVVVSNYPGTTVEVSHGVTKHKSKNYAVVDTPGVNSLLPSSEDEVVTRDILLTEKNPLLIQVADAKNLRRGLLISSQLAEMGLGFNLVLNMQDEARERGIKIDYKKLSSILGIKVIPATATEKKNLEQIPESLMEVRSAYLPVSYPSALEEGITRIAALLPESSISSRAIAVMLLSGDKSLKKWLNAGLSEKAVEEIEEICRECQARIDQPIAYLINQIRLKAVDQVVASVVEAKTVANKPTSARIDELSLHPVWGYAVLALVLLVFYLLVGVLGAGISVDFMEKTVFGRYLIPSLTKLVSRTVPVAWLQDLLVGPYGLLTMALTYAFALILPIITFFFIAFGFMEDSGYLPRLAAMSNKLFRFMGLNGKAILPMILGFGCGTMATLTTRILDTKRERIIVTLLLALGIPCSAQMSIIFGMVSSYSPLMIISWAGIITAVMAVVGYFSGIFMPGEPADFVLELPPVRMPKPANIAVKTFSRIEWYIREAVPLFALSTLILFGLDRLRMLAKIEAFAAPLIKGILGLPVETTRAFLIGFLRRDYGAAGLLALARANLLNPNQVLVSLVTITLFVPCLANFMVIIKERGMKTALAITLMVIAIAFGIGGLLNFILTVTGWTL